MLEELISPQPITDCAPNHTKSPDRQAEHIYKSVRQLYIQTDRQTTSTEEKRSQLQAVEQLVRSRTGTITELPWLEPRANPPPLDIPPCYGLPLPKDFIPHEPDDAATAALIPYAPPIEYLESPPENRAKIHTQIEALAQDILHEQGIDKLYQLASDNPSYRRALDMASSRENLTALYVTWAKDTAVDTADITRNLFRTHAVTKIFHSGKIASMMEGPRKPEGALYFPMPGDLDLAAESANRQLTALYQEVSRKIDNSFHHVSDYKQRTRTLHLDYRNILDCYRWHLDHHNWNDQFTHQALLDGLTNAYLGYNQVLQTCHRSSEGQGSRFEEQHDIAALTTGFKVDHAFDGRYGDNVCYNGNADYLDAFMAVSQSRQVSIEYAHCVQNRDQLQWHTPEGGRPLFGSFETTQKTSHQQLVIMAVLCLRMPQRQQETYKEMILAQFNAIQSQIPLDDGDEPLLFIPTQTTGSERHPHLYSFDFDNPQDITRSTHLYPFQTLLDNTSPQFLQNTRGQIQVRSRLQDHDGNTLDAVDFVGLNSHGTWTDEFGFVHPGPEQRHANPNDSTALEIFTEQARTWLDNLHQIPTLLTESRLGKEASKKINELLERNPETGSISAVAKFAATMERLLGRKPNAEESDFVTLLQELGMLNTEGLKLNEYDADQIQEKLQQLREGKADLSDLDEGSVVILILSTTGQIPRELLVELVFKTYENLGSVLTLEAAMALEKLETKRRFSLFGKKNAEPSKILSHRQQAREYLTNHQADPEYQPAKDPEFRTKTTEFIERITSLLHNNRKYDATMQSPLIAVLTAKEQDELVARCAVDGQLLTALLQFISPELMTHYAQTYGPEELMELTEWHEWLRRNKQSGDQSHGFNQTRWIEADDQPSLLIADATGGFTKQVEPDRISYPPTKNQALTYGQATYQSSKNILIPNQKVLGNCVTGGSSLMADIALDANQVDYAQLANPDSPSVLIAMITHPSTQTEQKVAALDKLLILEPHILAMCSAIDYNRGYAALRLNQVISLSLQTDHWGGAFFAVNILQHAGYLTADIHSHAAAIHQALADSMASQTQAEYEKSLAAHQNLLTPSDRYTIESARNKYLEELESRKQSPQEPEAKIEQQLRQTVLAALNHTLESEMEEIEAQGFALAQEDSINQKSSQEDNPTLGYTATEEYRSQIIQREDEIIGDAKGLPSRQVDTSIFETITSNTSEKAMKAILTGPNGEMLTGEKAAARLQLVQGVITKTAFDLALKKQLAEGESTIGLVNDPHFKQDFVTTATMLHNGFAATAKALGLTPPSYDPLTCLPTQSATDLFLE
jgi:hypothetical protein